MTSCQHQKLFWGAREERRWKNFCFGPFLFSARFCLPLGAGQPHPPCQPSLRPCLHSWCWGQVLLLIVSVVMSERSERKKFFLKRDVGRLTVGAGEPVRLIGGAADRGCDRRCAGAAVVEGESGRFLRSGVTRGRGYGRCGGARVYKGVFKIFLGQIFRVLRNSDAGGCGRHVQPSPGLGSGRGACVIGARLGAVICMGSAGLDRGGVSFSARSR